MKRYAATIRYNIDAEVELLAPAGQDLEPGSPDWERLANQAIAEFERHLILPEGVEPWFEVESIEEVEP